MTMHDGERVQVLGSSGTYELARKGPLYSCTCPAWLKQKLPPERRTCKHLRAHLGDAHEDARVGTSIVAAAQTRARKAILALPPEPPEVRAAREAAVAGALARFPAAAARMRAVYDMPLPRWLAHSVGFWLGLTPAERDESWSHFGCGLAGVTEWFEPDGLSRTAANDERLHHRFRRDPPEFVTVFSGNSDGSHWGLWYDDPRELPRQLGHNWARDDGETSLGKPTLLATLREQFTREPRDPGEWPLAKRILAWLDENLAQELAAHRDEHVPPPLPRTRVCTGGADPVVPGLQPPADFTAYPGSETRLDTYRHDPATARTWISQALQELTAGQPMRALFLARELHWFDGDELRDQAAELGMRAYQAVGRPQLAEVLRVHHAHRDLQSVDIYTQPPTPALVEAIFQTDAARITELLADTPDPTHIAQALEHVVAIPVLELLLAASPPDAAAHKLAITVDRIAGLHKYEIAAPEQQAVLEHLLTRGTDTNLAYTRALAGNLPALALRLADHLDVTRPDADGLPPLHRAVQSAAEAIVVRLLARGADPHARDAHGKTPHDRARDIWQDHRSESGVLLALLPAAPRTVALSTDHAVGSAVTHAKFGPGIVRACEGAGPMAKLTVEFNDGAKTMLAKFVTRRTDA